EARSAIHVSDLFIRPVLEEKRAEAWVEVYNCGIERVEDLSLRLSVFGQNFKKTVFKGRVEKLAYAGPTVNYYKVAFDMPKARLWELDSPWLYQAQVEVVDKKGKVLDVVQKQFGMRSFRMEEEVEPKGRFYFNEREIRLRGANTMGHMQQCVMKKDWDQLRDDILLAKICNMNFFRLTQRPVQPEIYDYCDRLGMMTQTDLPLFGELRRNQFAEAVRQAGEMERLVRGHPCNIMVSYINEPFANGHNKPHRHLLRNELEAFFSAADKAVRLANPDRVIKAVDGDYDPPAPGLPDNHCYNGWYNGHGLDLGKLHKGFWQKVKPGWHYGCGEFGAEGLDFADVMRKHYPAEWLPKNAEAERNWLPDAIPQAQTGMFHYIWFETPKTLDGWADASQEHQRWITQLMTEAFRRDSRMNTIAIHLFIDAFPSGWMKAIMDFERRPKPAFFAFRDALTPLAVSLRTDRYKFFAGEEVNIEAWICNDLPDAVEGCSLRYQLELGKKVVLFGRQKALIPVCESRFQGFVRFVAPKVDKRTQAVLRLGLLDSNGKVLHDSSVDMEFFPEPEPLGGKVVVVGAKKGKAAQLARELGLKITSSLDTRHSPLLLIDDYAQYDRKRKEIAAAVKNGATAVFVELPEGKYKVAGSNVEVVASAMNPRHFVSRNTGHRLVEGVKADDFKFWYDSSAGFVTPLLKTVFFAPGFKEVLTSGNGKWNGKWGSTLAAAEKRHGTGAFRICQISLAGRTAANPTAKLFARNLLVP
ncbi:MAG: glycoside hydrolase family 2 TIM barrel-domain containing protein, partial [Verrucomicrobiota bacterium]